MLALGIVLAHLIGDYLIQSHWMATCKTKQWWPAIAHGLTYTIPYAFITQSTLALFVICSTHIVIDRFRLARHFAWFKNQLGPKANRPRWADAKATGYPSDTPPWLAVWLMIIADNTIHLLINTAAILWLAKVGV
jgi:hypothetical protein